MAVSIRGIEMPKQCGNCPVSTNNRRCTILWREFDNPNERLVDCPLYDNSYLIENIKIALSLLTLAYHNKNYLDSSVCDNNKLIKEIEHLLTKALEKI